MEIVLQETRQPVTACAHMLVLIQYQITFVFVWLASPVPPQNYQRERQIKPCCTTLWLDLNAVIQMRLKNGE